MSNFDDIAGQAACKTPWGRWWQTIEEVFIEIELKEKTRGKDIAANISPMTIEFQFHDSTLLQGELSDKVIASESTWTIEDGKLLRILLVKANQDAANCWRSLMKDGSYKADPATFDEMQKKMTLQRFQFENPSFNFSDAKISGNYHGGGPKYST
ncbi:unnamed protein product [Soboliphyme baturini]|uniref:CS domain-containing protein n=1 Tax=Soboliphyme baturini TaxID=241478 RepID=A0A183J0N9_9BILA|nr:unnamed protein product [Soboliphyme baturini]